MDSQQEQQPFIMSLPTSTCSLQVPSTNCIPSYTIPAGWLVMISPMAVHLNPRLFEDPLNFNPWRWQEDNKNTLQRNFMPFGGGIRLCVGADFSKVFIAVFLHILVTNYRWREVKGGDVLRISEIVFPQGYHIQMLPRT